MPHKHHAALAHGAEPSRSSRIAELDALVPAWLTVPEAAERQQVSLATVRKQIQDRYLVAVRRGERSAVYIPADFVTAEGPLPGLRGTAVVLSDGGMSDDELLLWLFSHDESLAGGSTPIAQLCSGGKTEVRRRAMETAF